MFVLTVCRSGFKLSYLYFRFVDIQSERPRYTLSIFVCLSDKLLLGYPNQFSFLTYPVDVIYQLSGKLGVTVLRLPNLFSRLFPLMPTRLPECHARTLELAAPRK